MDADAIMRKLNGVVSRHETEIAALRADRKQAPAHLKTAMGSLANYRYPQTTPEHRSPCPKQSLCDDHSNQNNTPARHQWSRHP
ncbi:MAG: hypothetical protein JWQ23_4048 [Herminiimonas sp.]|jgi:hypothetical protein|nr:hypothetical protein [Herminiimonas sp.]